MQQASIINKNRYFPSTIVIKLLKIDFKHETRRLGLSLDINASANSGRCTNGDVEMAFYEQAQEK